MLKEEKGVTLVMLVLIIVVLLILSGVAISVVIQNNDALTPNQNLGLSSKRDASISYEDAKSKVKLIFELYEANYQIELSKGNVTNRNQVFTAESIAEVLEEYNVTGNTESSLGEIDLNEGITVNHGEEYTFLVKVSSNGMVTVTEK